MSQLANGTEDLPQGVTPAAAYGIINTDIQKLAQMTLHEQVVPFYGLCRDGTSRGRSVVAIERLLTAVEIRVEGDLPSGGSLIVQVNIQGTLQWQQFAIAAGGSYGLITVNSGGLVIPANNWSSVQITTASGASDVVVVLKSQLRIL